MLRCKYQIQQLMQKKKLDSISTYSEFREYYGKLSNVIQE